MTNRSTHIALACFALLALAGCTTPPKQLPVFDAAIYGVGGCPVELRNRCAELAGKTFLSKNFSGQWQVDYFSPDGHVSTWGLIEMGHGYWRFTNKQGGQICYEYGYEYSRRCDYHIGKGVLDESRPGDVYGLSTRTTPPGDLRKLSPFSSTFEDVDRLLARTAVN